MKIQFELLKCEMENLNKIMSTDLIKKMESQKSWEISKVKENEKVYIIEWDYVSEEDLIIINDVCTY